MCIIKLSCKSRAKRCSRERFGKDKKSGSKLLPMSAKVPYSSVSCQADRASIVSAARIIRIELSAWSSAGVR